MDEEYEIGKHLLLDKLVSHLVQQEVDDAVLSSHSLIVQPVSDLVQHLQ